ncbi:hypothetical protein EJ02DRAFT_47627 [Clathrospora elynae]|uniref:Uncharacterized protein n=1 Tax=Clathrospora elynae TaxID=706981 RepID=A0A6A5SE28_9PLEO|nr:hypothetical protein EJ02DRAFT_47627 [Clathrospora elynae]
MLPSFIFQIDEIGENVNALAHHDEYGNWKPSTDAGANQNLYPRVGTSGRHWFCNGQRIREISQRPAGAQLYKSYSAYYVGGVGFWFLQGDARTFQPSNVFHKLQFGYYNNLDFSSYLTNAGQYSTLRCQPHDRRWAHMLLPTIYHSDTPTTNPDYGGVVGELPIFLALMAFSTSREELPSILPHMFTGGSWAPTHQWQRDRIDRRGIVVTVYTCPADYPPNAPQGYTGSTDMDLYNMEMGILGKYFY